MTTELLFRDDAYLREAAGTVVALTPDGGIVLDRSVFYATSGGQPGDAGVLHHAGGEVRIAVAVKGEGGAVVLRPDEGQVAPPPGTPVRQVIDWERRYGHMRVHTALHLLSVVIPRPVTGGAISADRGRLDFDLPDPPTDLAALERQLNGFVESGLAVSESWITEAELAANPGLVKTMSVAPPVGQGRVRLVRIGSGESQVDLQPCGGTHVRSTAEIGPLKIGRIENKGRQNRRVTILLGQ